MERNSNEKYNKNYDENLTNNMIRKTDHSHTEYEISDVFVKALKRISSILPMFVVEHSGQAFGREMCLSPSPFLSLSLSFSSSLSSVCPQLQYCLAPSPRPHSLRWPKMWHKTLRKCMAKNTTKICSKKYKHLMNYEENITRDDRHPVTIKIKYDEPKLDNR